MFDKHLHFSGKLGALTTTNYACRIMKQIELLIAKKLKLYYLPHHVTLSVQLGMALIVPTSVKMCLHLSPALPKHSA